MLIRLVKLSLQEDNINQFQAIFEERRERIAHAPGCLGVALLQDIKHPNILFTHSNWDNETSLNLYRDSEFFIETWKLVKPLFAAPAQAWSVEEK